MSMTMSKAGDVWTVVLAAGASTRFGMPKQLYRWKGLSFLQHALNHATEVSAGRVVVVTGAHAGKLSKLVDDRGIALAHNAGWQSGMGSSIRVGIAALPTDCLAALIMPCDQPLVDAQDLGDLVRLWREAPDQAVASAYSGTFGIPAVVPARLFPALVRLRGDSGAKDILRSEGGRLRMLELPAAHLDIDELADTSELARRAGNGCRSGGRDR